MSLAQHSALTLSLSKGVATRIAAIKGFDKPGLSAVSCAGDTNSDEARNG